MNDETQKPEDDLTLPPALVAALRRADGGNLGNAGLQARFADAEFLAKARAEMAAARHRKTRLALFWAGSSLLAASLALVVTLSLQPAPVRPHTGDIRDAFALACALRDKAQVSKADDFNHDGQVNGNDVRALAMAAVSLKGVR